MKRSVINLLRVLLSVGALPFLGCSPKDSGDIVQLKKSLKDESGNVFTIELDSGGSKIHFGYSDSIDGGIYFSGHVSKDNRVIYHTHSRDDAGLETIIADVGCDGVPDYWILMDPGGEVIERRKIDELKSPF